MFEIGNSLREARQRRGLDVLQSEQATKIRAKYLRALEDEQFDVLPGETYVKGFLQAYADFLGLEGSLYVDEYNSRFLLDDDRLRERRRRTRRLPRAHRRAERNVVVLALLGIAVLTALIIVAWRFGGGGEGASVPNLPQGVARPPTAPVAPTSANLSVRAAGGSSLLQVRAGSASGRLLYQGTLERGQSQRFAARRLWIYVGSPENLTLRLNGRPVEFGGRCPRVFVVTAKQSVSSAYC